MIDGNSSTALLVGRRIAKLRQQQGLSQGELGEHIGVTGSAISRMESGSRGVSHEQARALAEAFGVAPGQILFGEGGESQSVESEGAQTVIRLGSSWSFERSHTAGNVIMTIVVPPGKDVEYERLFLRQAADRRDVNEEAAAGLGSYTPKAAEMVQRIVPQRAIPAARKPRAPDLDFIAMGLRPGDTIVSHWGPSATIVDARKVRMGGAVISLNEATKRACVGRMPSTSYKSTLWSAEGISLRQLYCWWTGEPMMEPPRVLVDPSS